ncbi:flippase [Limosilactobacillus pontis]|uniref:Flippase n=1 Tax=Limosilactobacillus pontis TaxID=35787 RepID=A0ABT7UZV9_9LACO|nr:flippase [Limosilactobacillus pontis]MDM8267236.1 flippase [Limosilactobacillus pontis]
MNRSRSLGINALLNGLRNCLNLIFPLVTFPYVSRILSVKGMGIYNFSNTYVGYFLLIAGLGINTYAVREGAKYRDNTTNMSLFASQVFTINIYSTIIAYLLLFVSIIIFNNLSNYVACIIIFSIQLFFTTLGTEWIYVIYEDYSYITIRSILFKIISLALLFMFVKNKSDYLIYAGITVFSAVGSNILNYIHAKSMLSIRIVRKTDLHRHLKPIIIIFASAVAVNIYIYSNNIILGLLKGDYDVGLFSVAVKIYTIVQGILTAVLTVTIPRLAMLYGKKLFNKYHALLAELINFLIIISLPAIVGLFVLSKEVILLIAGEKYLPSTQSLKVISFAIVFSIFSWVFSDCVLIPAKREAKLFRGTVITAALNLIFNFILIPIYAYNGAAFCTVLSELVMMVINGYYSWDIVRNIVISRNVIKNLFDSLLGCLGILIVCYVFQLYIDTIIFRICMSIVASAFVYFCILALLKNKVMIYLIKSGLKFIKHN